MKQIEHVYDHKAIEGKWQEVWAKNRVYEPSITEAKKPYYNLMMFPYPSAEGLHVGNVYAFCGSDVYGRYKRMNGNDVFEPIGLDGFGIHSENYALKAGKHPVELAKETEKNFYRQLHLIGNGFAWSKKLETYDPTYYKFTQWIFIELFKAGLAYRAKSLVNWCLSCKTVLADEQVVKKNLEHRTQNLEVETPNSKFPFENSQGKQTRKEKFEVRSSQFEPHVCERCGSEVQKKDLEQWFFKITNYSQRLLDNLENLDWSEKVKVAQRRWIGKSGGAEVVFTLDIDSAYSVRVFTTRPDTIFGVTFLVLAPKHPLVTTIIDKTNGPLKQAISKYVEDSLQIVDDWRKEDFLDKKNKAKETVKKGVLRERKGIFAGLYAKNPMNGEKVPVYIADYVLTGYGTGAVMGVPAHNERDFGFAKEHGLEIRQVVKSVESRVKRETPNSKFPFENSQGKQTQNSKLQTQNQSGYDFSQGVFTEEGVLVNSGEFNGMESQKAIISITKYIEEKQIGLKSSTWHLRDWIISRQRYWGAPIPMIFCKYCADKGLSWFDTEDAKNHQIRNPKSEILNKSKIKNSNGGKLRTSNFEFRTSEWNSAGWYPEAESNLPVLLPYIENFKPAGTGVSPLAQDSGFVNTKCPGCGKDARRETDVSDTFLDSAWYYLRYPSVGLNSNIKARNTKQDRSFATLRMTRGVGENFELRTSNFELPWNSEITKRWLPVDMYIGGAEHSVLHLLYSRFITMVFKDLGLVDFEEPFSKFRAHGLLIKDGSKMSKSKGNVINPDDYVEKFGADTLRCYLMFCGRYDVGGDFRDSGMEGMHRFLKRVWRMAIGQREESPHFAEASWGKKVKSEENENSKLPFENSQGKQTQNSKFKIQNLTLDQESERMMNVTIKRVTEDIESLSYNTAIAALMEWLNFLEEKIEVKTPNSKLKIPNSKKESTGGHFAKGQTFSPGESQAEGLALSEVKTFLLLLAPFAPHMAEEIWQNFLRNSKFQIPNSKETPNAKSQIQKGARSFVSLRMTGGGFRSIHTQSWPKLDEAKIRADKVTLVVQVNGKVRDKIEINAGISQEEAENVAIGSEKVKKFLTGKYGVVYVQDKIINFVTSQ